MALKEIAVQGAALVDDTVGNVTSISITSVPSTKMKADLKGIFSKQLNFLVSACTDSTGCVLTAPIPGVMNPTATKTKEDGFPVMRVDDNKTVSGAGLRGGTVPCTVTCAVRISNAGQTKVKGE